MKFSVTLLTCLAQLFSVSLAATTEEWKTRNIYFALTDRVARSSDDTGGDACSNLGNYCGGTYKGLEGKLDYIQGMGFDALWITPIIENKDGGYHGYWAQNLDKLNTNYGSGDDLKALIAEVQSRGMYIMIDVVANHFGPGDVSENGPAPFSDASSYHDSCAIDYSVQESVQTCRIADNIPDVKTTNQDVRDAFYSWIGDLVSDYSIDGLRVDTVKHVEMEFWSNFVAAAGVYAIGEVFEPGSPAYVGPYQDVMPGLLNYPIYKPLTAFFLQEGSSQDLADMFDSITDEFSDPSALGTFIDNHDNPRWLSLNADEVLLKNALAYTILARGIPIVYYGTEQAFDGDADPNNREDLWRTNFDTTSDLYQAISRLSAARATAGGLGGDDHVQLDNGDTWYAWSRVNGDLVVFTSNGGSGFSGQQCFDSQVPNGSWDDVFNSGSYTSDSDGQLCVDVNGGEPIVLWTNISPEPPVYNTTSAASAPATTTSVPVTLSSSFTADPGVTTTTSNRLITFTSTFAANSTTTAPTSYSSAPGSISTLSETTSDVAEPTTISTNTTTWTLTTSTDTTTSSSPATTTHVRHEHPHHGHPHHPPRKFNFHGYRQEHGPGRRN